MASVSRIDDGDAVVVSGIEAMFWLPPLIRSTLRWMVSPADTPVALMFNRLLDAPVAPRFSVTVPLVMDCGPPVAELVNVANVPSPAIDAAAPKAPNDNATLAAKVFGMRISSSGLLM